MPSKIFSPNSRLLSALNAFMDRAYVFSMLSENDKAFADLDRADALINKSQKPVFRTWEDRTGSAELCIEAADINIRRAWIHKTKGEINRAIHCCKKGLVFSERILTQLHANRYISKQDIGVRLLKKIGGVRAAGYNTLGTVYADRSRYSEAIRYLKKFLSISKELDDKGWMGIAANNLGFVYDNLGDYDRAIRFHKRALALTAASGDKSNQGLANNNLGYIYYVKCEYEKAIKYYHRYLQISREIGSRLGKALALNNLGGAYLQTGDYEKARAHLRDAEQLFVEIGDRYTLVETYLFFAELFVKDAGSAPDNATRLRKAFECARRARRSAVELGSTYRIACCHLTSARLRTAARDFERAAFNYDKAIRLFKSIDQNRELIDAYSEYGRLIGSMHADPDRRSKRLLAKQAQCFARARRLCKKLKLYFLLRKTDDLS